MKNQEWFEMADLRRRRLETAVWVPLRRSEQLSKEGDASSPGCLEEFDAIGAVAIYPEHRELAEARGWSDFGLITTASYASTEHPYKPADVVWYHDGEPIGISLVLVNALGGYHRKEWIVHPDLVIALRLLHEGDSWLSVDEGYVEVIRQRRGKNGDVVAIEIKADFLRDYLSARGMPLRLVQFHSRMEITETIDHLSWPEGRCNIDLPSERLELRANAIGPDGGPPNSRMAVMRVWRTDVDHEQDAPVFGPETNDNTAYESHSFVQDGGQSGFRVEGSLWRETWIEPAERSIRVRGDEPTNPLRFVVDPSGATMSATELNDEDIGRWLFFRPQVIDALLAYRGSGLQWYTAETGGVECSPHESIHFGIDATGLINVYASDVAGKAPWQQQIWLGHNVVPNGPVCSELLDSQMRADPASTDAPENLFRDALKSIDERFVQLHGHALFHVHPDTPAMLSRMHRFRGLSGRPGVLSLAKDIARATADAIDVARLRKLAPSDIKPGLGSLKLLDAYLAQRVGASESRTIMGPLVGIYELRLGDAHPASSSIAEAFALAQVDLEVDGVQQAKQLLLSAATVLRSIGEASPSK